MPDGVGELDLLINCFPSYFFVIVGIKWKMSGKHQKYDDAEGPAVDASIIWLLKKDLGGNIAQGPERLAAGLTWAKCFAQAKIN